MYKKVRFLTVMFSSSSRAAFVDAVTFPYPGSSSSSSGALSLLRADVADDVDVAMDTDQASDVAALCGSKWVGAGGIRSYFAWLNTKGVPKKWCVEVAVPDNWKEFEHLYVAMNTGNHWVLVDFNRLTHTGIIYDSLRSGTAAAPDTIKQYAEKIDITKLVYHPDMPQQQNTDDCGVWVMAIATALLLNGALIPSHELQHSQMRRWRRQIAHDIKESYNPMVQAKHLAIVRGTKSRAPALQGASVVILDDDEEDTGDTTEPETEADRTRLIGAIAVRRARLREEARAVVDAENQSSAAKRAKPSNSDEEESSDDEVGKALKGFVLDDSDDEGA